MPRPINIDVSGLGEQFGLSQAQIDDLTERCVQAVTAAVYANWEALAKSSYYLPPFIIATGQRALPCYFFLTVPLGTSTTHVPSDVLMVYTPFRTETMRAVMPINE